MMVKQLDKSKRKSWIYAFVTFTPSKKVKIETTEVLQKKPEELDKSQREYLFKIFKNEMAFLMMAQIAEAVSVNYW